MVPFRLTQNMIDAFGVSGQEGVFRRTAEITLQVLLPVSIHSLSAFNSAALCTLHADALVNAQAHCLSQLALHWELCSPGICDCADLAPTRQPPQVLRRQ